MSRYLNVHVVIRFIAVEPTSNMKQHKKRVRFERCLQYIQRRAANLLTTPTSSAPTADAAEAAGVSGESALLATGDAEVNLVLQHGQKTHHVFLGQRRVLFWRPALGKYAANCIRFRCLSEKLLVVFGQQLTPARDRVSLST